MKITNTADELEDLAFHFGATVQIVGHIATARINGRVYRAVIA